VSGTGLAGGQKIEAVGRGQLDGAAAGGHAPRPPLAAVRAWLDQRFFVLATIPALVLVTAVVAIPLVLGIYLSFTDYQPIDPSFKFAGLVNYDDIFSNTEIHTAIINTLVFAGAGIVVEGLLGFAFALLLARRFRGVTLFRLMFLMPLMVAGVASATAWHALLNTGQGWVNYFFSVVGLPPLNWLASPHTAMISVILADAWSGVPIVSVILLAGLLTLPGDPVEAARIDGASEFSILRYVTLPGLRPVLAFAVLFRLVDLFRQFALFSIMTGGGPGLSTNVLNFYVYQTSFVFGELGLGAALAVVLVVFMAVPLILVFQMSRRRP
jgi:multiple sugar transport system permease protein